MITKQECMILLGCLDLVLCSESIDKVSISGNVNITKNKKPNTLLSKYKSRDLSMKNLSLHEFFHRTKNGSQSRAKKEIIPHYVGAYTTHIYPPTIQYAKSMLLIYKPWHYQSQIAQSSDWIAEFNKFVNSNDAPESLKCAYKAAKQRKETKNKLQKIHQLRKNQQSEMMKFQVTMKHYSL